MILSKELIKSGNWLFKRRSFLPLLMYLFATLLLILFPLNEQISLYKEISFLLISLFGLSIRALVIGYIPESTSGRNRNNQIAKTLNTEGLYSCCRNPLYVGNFFIWLGVILYIENISFVIISCLIYILYYERIILAEEAFLKSKFKEKYIKWANAVPAFFPKKTNWVKPPNNFSFRNILLREYSGFYAIFISFFYFHLLKNYLIFNEIIISSFWIYTLIIATIITVILRTLKKYTKVLHKKGR